MKTSKRSKGYEIRAKHIRAITREHYEPGRQDRNLKWVWRHHIMPLYGIGYRAYLFYLEGKTHVSEENDAAE